MERTYAVPSGYDRVTLWVYGDGQRETLALTTDAGETNAAVIDFTGWQQLTFTLPDKAASITGFALRLPSALSGTLYLDQLVAAREAHERYRRAGDLRLPLRGRHGPDRQGL
ncbi:MAG: hypothetical protein ACLR4W_00440 [Oscillospiraceae bacterium]